MYKVQHKEYIQYYCSKYVQGTKFIKVITP